MFDWVLNTPLLLTVISLHSSIIAEFSFIHELKYFVLIKESNFLNF